MKVLHNYLIKHIKQSLLICSVLLLQSVITNNTLALTPLQQPEEVIKIGILVPDKNSLAAIQGAELAISEVNRHGGINGFPVKLVTRSMEGPWGTGSKQAINLIFEEKVWALFGSHDGRNAHLVEQAATKATVVFVSAWSGDPTLSQAFVPWFYNCVPTDFQQAETLVEEIYDRRKLNRVVTIIDDEYDSDLAFKNFMRKIDLDGKIEPLKFNYENYLQNLTGLLDEINKQDADCIVLFCKPSASYKIFRAIRMRGMRMPIFGSLNLLNDNELTEQELQEYQDVLLIPSPAWNHLKSLVFITGYKEMFGKRPGMIAAYAFDGMNVLIEAIRIAGSREREKIQKALSGITYEGITGTIRFDDKGNRLGPFITVTLLNGIPVLSDQ